MTRLRTEGEQARKTLAAKQQELASALAEVARWRSRESQNAELNELKRRVTELESRLAEAGRASEQTRAENERLAQELSSACEASERTRVEHEQSKARIAELERELEAARSDVARTAARVARNAATPGGSDDDLTTIRGIGPKFARALVAAGIHRVADIAAWTDAEIDAIAPKLKVKPERIRRERWVEHAREISRTMRSA